MKTSAKTPKLGLTEIINEAQDSVLYHGDRPVAVIQEKLLICDKRLTPDSVKALAEKYQTRVDRVRRVDSLEQAVHDVYILLEARDDEEQQVDLMAGAGEADVMPTIPTSREVQRQPWEGARATKQGGSWHVVINEDGDSICYSYATPIAAVLDGVLTFPTREGSRAYGNAYSFSATSSQHFAKYRRVVQYSSERGVPMEEFTRLITPIVQHNSFPVGKRGNRAIGGTGRLPQAYEGKAKQKESAAKPGFLVNVTYETWSPEAIDAGDTDDRGFDSENEFYSNPYEVARMARDMGATDSQGKNWFSTVDDEQNFRTGEATQRAVHIKNADGSDLSPEMWAAFVDHISGDGTLPFPGYDEEGNPVAPDWQDPTERLPFPEKKGKQAARESFLHPGEYTVEIYREDNTGSNNGMIPSERGLHFSSLPRLINFLATQMPVGILDAKVELGVLTVYSEGIEVDIHKGEESSDVGLLTDADAKKIKTLVNERTQGATNTDADPLAWQRGAATQPAMMESEDKVEKKGKRVVEEVGSKFTVVVKEEGKTDVEKEVETVDAVISLAQDNKVEQFLNADSSTKELCFVGETMRLCVTKSDDSEIEDSVRKELISEISGEAAPETIGDRQPKEWKDLPEARQKKPTLPARLYKVAVQNLELIKDLEESVSDDTGAVAAVKTLAIRLAKAMKARDKSLSLAFVEKLDLQIRSYMALRETTGVHNYLVMERFHTFQKRTHQMFNEEAREWVQFINQK